VNGRDLVGIGAMGLLGGTFGWPTGPVGIAVLTVVGLSLGWGAARAGARWLVVIPVAAGTGIGALVGWSVVHAICRPASCAGAEITAAVVTGIGSLVGVGLVVALAARSFDEYREAVATNRPPPEAGCEAEEGPEA
jgi:hypothetical protein